MVARSNKPRCYHRCNVPQLSDVLTFCSFFKPCSLRSIVHRPHFLCWAAVSILFELFLLFPFPDLDLFHVYSLVFLFIICPFQRLFANAFISTCVPTSYIFFTFVLSQVTSCPVSAHANSLLAILYVLYTEYCTYKIVYVWNVWTLQEAIACLNIHSQRIRAENRSLRHELLSLIRKSQALREHERRLLEQRHALRAERQYADDLGRLRAERRMRSDPAICAAATGNEQAPLDDCLDSTDWTSSHFHSRFKLKFIAFSIPEIKDLYSFLLSYRTVSILFIYYKNRTNIKDDIKQKYRSVRISFGWNTVKCRPPNIYEELRSGFPWIISGQGGPVIRLAKKCKVYGKS